MFRTLCAAAVAAVSLAIPAHADFSTFDCVDHPTGLLVGYIEHTEASAVSIRCYVALDNGSEVYSTPTGSGIGAATTAGMFVLGEGHRLCIEAVDSHGVWEVCRLS